MGGVKRTRSGIDALEHALRGVQTSENHERIVSFGRHLGLISESRSVVKVDVMDDSPVEQEVTVYLPDRRRHRRR